MKTYLGRRDFGRLASEEVVTRLHFNPVAADLQDPEDV